MKICDRLIAVGSVICYNVRDSHLSTFGSGGAIDTLVIPSSESCLRRVSEILGTTKFTILGKGSNTLISDDGVEEIVLSLKKIDDHKVLPDGLYLGAGVSNIIASKLARDNYMQGLEFLAGIPGSIGGSICMNAGAFGSSIGDFVEYIDVAKCGTLERISGHNIHFGYRYSGIEDIIVGAKLRLDRGNPIVISNTMKKYQMTRKRSQPNLPSLGSVFKRVDDISAGYYIEKAGLVGYRIGGAEVSDVHANFIVNKGGATSTDFVMLMEFIEDIVYKRFGIRLTREVRCIGRGFEEVR